LGAPRNFFTTAAVAAGSSFVRLVSEIGDHHDPAVGDAVVKELGELRWDQPILATSQGQRRLSCPCDLLGRAAGGRLPQALGHGLTAALLQDEFGVAVCRLIGHRSRVALDVAHAVRDDPARLPLLLSSHDRSSPGRTQGQLDRRQRDFAAVEPMQLLHGALGFQVRSSTRPRSVSRCRYSVAILCASRRDRSHATAGLPGPLRAPTSRDRHH